MLYLSVNIVLDMGSCNYEIVHCDMGNEKEDNTWKPFLIQLYICSNIWPLFFGIGLWIGSPTVVIPQLRREANSTAVVSDDMESWLSSVMGYATLPWAIFFPICMQRYGRKRPSIFASFCSLISFAIYYCASTPMQILVAEIVQSIVFASNVTVSILVLTEYTSPKYRGVFLNIKSASMNIGIWVANALGTFFHWKIIPLLGCVCTASCLGAVFWSESPYWLASKGRFKECERSHRWLKGTNNDAEKELRNLIETQKEFQKTRDRINMQARSPYTLKRFLEIITSKGFYKPTTLSVLILTLYQFSGKFVCIVYATQIIRKISNSESTAYTGMLILDGITVFSMYVGCALSKILKRRTLLLSTSVVGASFLYVFSLYLYLIQLLFLQENNIVSLLLLTGYSISIGFGPMIMATSVFAELIPLRNKTLSIILTVMYNGICHATILKSSPTLFRVWGMHGTFFFFAFSFSLCVYLVYKFLPETKDKTLQEIENCFTDHLQDGQELKVLNTFNNKRSFQKK